MTSTPTRKRRKAKSVPAFSVEVRRQMRAIENRAFVKWAEKCLRAYFSTEQAGVVFNDLVDRALALGVRVEKTKAQDLEKSKYPISYYMLQDPDGAVITGMIVTCEQLMEEVLKQRPAKKRRLKLHGSTNKTEAAPADSCNG